MIKLCLETVIKDDKSGPAESENQARTN